jgi:hypothetical protein
MSAKAPAKPTTVPTLDQFIDTMNRRKMFWEFHLGTIGAPVLTAGAIAAAGPGSITDFPVTLDGDSENITAQSLVGNLGAGQRVAVVFVPPASYNIVGVLGGAQTNAILDAVNVLSGTLAGPASATTHIPALDLACNVVAGRNYLISVQFFITGTVATDLFDISCNANSTAGPGVGFTPVPVNSSPMISWPYIPTVSGATNFLVSFTRKSGTGTATIFGSANGALARTWAMVQDVTSVWRTA